MNDVKFTADQIKKLEEALLEIPAKFCIPLLQLINGFIQENSRPIEVEQVEQVEP